MGGGTPSRLPTRDGLTSFRIDGAGPPLVLVHGLQVGQELFDALRQHLTAAFTVITYDQRDRGETVFAPTAYTTDDLADDLAALLMALGLPRAHIVGTSFGGMVAQSFALRHPHLVDALVLGATSQAPFRPEVLSGPVADLLSALESGDDERARALLARLVPTVPTGPTGPTEPTAPTAPTEPTEPTGPTGRVARSRAERSDALARRFAATRGFDTRGRLGAIDARVLVVRGRDEAMVPMTDVLAMAEAIPRADVLMLADAGHAWESDQPARAAAAISAFLLHSV